MRASDGLLPQGKLEIFVTRGQPKLILGEEISGRRNPTHRSAELDFSNCDILSRLEKKNIIVNNGKDKVIQSLTDGFVNVICRMAIGDRGALASNLQVPKVPTTDMTALYNEVYRSDVDTTVEDIGSPDTHAVTLIKTFSTAEVPLTSFSNQANPVVNEVGLIMCDIFSGAPRPRPDVAAPATPDADESLFSIRTFKSVPFDAADEIAVTIKYTVFVE